MTFRSAAIAGLIALASLMGAVTRATAELPALSREFRSERYVTETRELESIRRQRRLAFSLSAGVFQRGDDPGSWSPTSGWKQVGGGRAAVEFTRGRLTLGADGVASTRDAVDDHEFEQRATLSAYAPELRSSFLLAAGFGDSRYQGTDLTWEALGLRWRVPIPSTDLRPRVYTWMRYRRTDDPAVNVLTPAVGAYLQHAVVVASAPTLGAALMTDLRENGLPSSRLLVTLGWGSHPGAVGSTTADEDSPTAVLASEPVSSLHRSWFFQAVYAAPLDSRLLARLSVQAGLRFVQPY
jgi:hypothetical protein